MTKSGWYWVVQSPKWHYFDKSKTSICGRWLVLGIDENNLEDANDKSLDNCKQCQKKVLKLRETQKEKV